MPQWTLGEALLFQVLIWKSNGRAKTERKNKDWAYLNSVLNKVDILIGVERFKDKCKRSLRTSVRTDSESHLKMLGNALQVVNYKVNPKDLVSAMVMVAEKSQSDLELSWINVFSQYALLDPVWKGVQEPADKLRLFWEQLAVQVLPKELRIHGAKKEKDKDDLPPKSPLERLDFRELERQSQEPRVNKDLEACVEMSKLHLKEMHNFAAIHSASEPDGHWKLWNKKKKRQELFEASRVVIAVTMKGKVVGFASCKANPKGVVLHEVHVLEPFRRAGVGSRLFHFCISPFRGAHSHVIIRVLTDNVPAKRFFRTLGFSFPIVDKNAVACETALENAEAKLQEKLRQQHSTASPFTESSSQGNLSRDPSLSLQSEDFESIHRQDSNMSFFSHLMGEHTPSFSSGPSSKFPAPLYKPTASSSSSSISSSGKVSSRQRHVHTNLQHPSPIKHEEIHEEIHLQEGQEGELEHSEHHYRESSFGSFDQNDDDFGQGFQDSMFTEDPNNQPNENEEEDDEENEENEEEGQVENTGNQHLENEFGNRHHFHTHNDYVTSSAAKRARIDIS